MTEPALIELLSWLDDARITTWLDGGWGVDALMHSQSRSHSDVDLIVQVKDVPRLQTLLAGKGFTIKNDTSPYSFVLANGAGFEVDIHAVTFDGAGNGIYSMENGQNWTYPAEGFSGQGIVADRRVRCLSAAAQVLCHAEGYTPTVKDFQDMELLRQRFGVELPEHLQAGSVEGLLAGNEMHFDMDNKIKID